MTGTAVVIFCIGVVTFEAVYTSFVLFVETHYLFPTIPCGCPLFLSDQNERSGWYYNT